MPTRDAQVAEGRVLSRLLVEVSEMVKASFETIAASFGLPVHLARAVVLLEVAVPMRDLAEQIGCDRSYVTSIADQLEGRGLVSRTTGTDRRVKLLGLTAEGARVRDRITQALTEDDLVLRRLDDAQRRALRPLLEALAAEPS